MALIKQALEMICDLIIEIRKHPKNTGMYMQNVIEQEFEKMIAEMQALEKRIQELNIEGIRVNEELAATVEILKNQIDTVTTK